jgi:hypothetical protein
MELFMQENKKADCFKNDKEEINALCGKKREVYIPQYVGTCSTL